jgi:K+-transporting ATPase KdpF subunit
MIKNILQEREVFMDFILTGILTIGIVGYLIYTLIYPEKF